VKRPYFDRPHLSVLTLWVAAFLSLMGIALSPSFAQEADIDGAATLALAGNAKIGKWAEFRVTLTNRSATPVSLRLETSGVDGDGVPVIYDQEDKIDLAPQATDTLRPVAFVGPLESEMKFSAIDADGKTRWSRTIRVRGANGFHLPTQEVVATVGTPIGVKELRAASDRSRAEAIVDAVVPKVDALPFDRRGYDGMDVVAIVTSKAGSIVNEIDPAQFTALESWVRQGGTVWLLVGESATQILSPESKWKQFTSAELVGVERIRRGAPYEQFTGSALRFDASAADEALPKIARIRVRDGRIERAEPTPGQKDRPILVRSRHGFGEVMLATVDLDQSPFAEWAGRPVVLNFMLEGRTTPRAKNALAEAIHSGTQLGFTDLAGQLRAAVDHFPGLSSGTFTLVGLVMVAYLLLLGPGDFFLCRWFGRQWMHLTWFTFPLLVAGCAALAITLTNYSRQHTPLVNQLDICDVDVMGNSVRGFTVASLFSPQTTAYDLELQVDPQMAKNFAERLQGDACWLGLPGSGLGSLESANAEARNVAPPFRTPYRTILDAGGMPKLSAVPIQAQSSKPIIGEWEATLSSGDYGALRVLPIGRLEGEIVNPLSIELSEVRVIHDNRYYALPGTWLPGAQIDVGQVWPVSLEGRLRLRSSKDGKELSSPWDPQSRQLSRIVDALFFYDAAGGREYIGMTNRYNYGLDMSSLQQSGQAVVVARAKQQVTHWSRSNGSNSAPASEALPYSQSTSYVRLVWPVTKPKSQDADE
jgi:hypothetical protein